MSGMLLATTGVMWDIDWVVVQGFFTAVTTVILAATVGVAAKQLHQTRLLRRDQLQPHVVVDIEPAEGGIVFELAVRNYGVSTALNVRVAMDPPVETTMAGNNFGWYHFFATGIPTLPPGREIRGVFDGIKSREEQGLPMRFKASVDFDDVTGETHHQDYAIDLSIHANLWQVERKTTDDVVAGIHDVAQEMRRWTGPGFKGLRVFTEDYQRHNWDYGRGDHPRAIVRVFQQVVKATTGINLAERSMMRRVKRRIR